MNIPTIAGLDVSGKRVLMRVDFNVPVDKDGAIQSDRRIVQVLPTIEQILAQQPRRLILMSHLGRPKGQGYEARYSMAPVAERLSQLLKRPVTLGPKSVVGAELDDHVAAMRSGDVVLMENLRFHPEETLPDQAEQNPGGELLPGRRQTLDAFVAAIARLGDVYVNDAFGTCHRTHASMVGVPAAIRSAGGQAAAGLLVEKEIKCMGGILSTCESPFILILGGAKVADKIKLIERMLPKVDRLLIGGAMAYTFLKAMGTAVGKSRVDDQSMEVLAEAVAAATLRGAMTVIGGGDTAAAVEALSMESRYSHVSTGGGASLAFLEGSHMPALEVLRAKSI